MSQFQASSDLIKKLKPFYARFEKITHQYWAEVYRLEQEMNKTVQMEGLEFFFCDNDCAGIGNADRTMKLIHERELK